MEDQSYAKHAKFAPPFHFFLVPLTLILLVGSFVNLYESVGDHSRLYNASLITGICIALFVASFLVRVFPLKAQDRAIRAEENLRHYVLTGKLLDPRLTVRQIIALRFASEAELPGLAQKAANESLAPDDIKKSVKNWKADHDRL